MAATAALLVALVATLSAQGGSPPNRLDRNLGVVIASPRIHNLFWDSGWDGRHRAFPRRDINAFSNSLTTYLSPARQYGVGRPSFGSSNLPAAVCGAARAPAAVSAATLHAWITCMVTDPRTGVPKPRIRIPVSNDLYMVYLPSRTLVVDNISVPRFSVLGRNFGPFTLLARTSCTDYAAYHFFSTSVLQPFAYGVVATRCSTNLRGVTASASHEIVEAATDPFPSVSWIDNSISLAPPGFARLTRGEAADICTGVGAVPTPPVDVGRFRFGPYWSNRAGACVAA